MPVAVEAGPGQEPDAATMNPPTQKSFYVEISRSRDRAELVTNDAKELREQLEAVTGERISTLKGIGEAGRKRGPERKRSTDAEQGAPVSRDRGRSAGPELEPDRAPKSVDRGLGL